MKTSSPTERASKRAKRRLSSLAARGMRATLERTSVQKIYESMVWNQIQGGPIPEHIGVILDGNRRWARSRGLAPWKGHEQGARKMEDFLDWCGDIDEIRSITLYTFSMENFKRSEKEVTEIFRLLKEYLNSLLKDERIVKNEIRVKMLGRIEMLPEEFQELIRQVEEKTAHYRKQYLNFAIAYGGRTEIVDAVRSLAENVKEEKLSLDDISEKVIESYLYTAHLPKCSPDMIIRTSGEVRLSNFLTWQGAYSELCFVDVYWPDFRKLDLLRAIRMYQHRQRRFGG
jgi:tritrans,polycis-undecaprenyl-diphosphate synthase [geranylgeranyl-diphosphate specific]